MLGSLACPTVSGVRCVEMGIEALQLGNEMTPGPQHGGGRGRRAEGKQLKHLLVLSSPERAQREQQVPGAGKPGQERESSVGGRTGWASVQSGAQKEHG